MTITETARDEARREKARLRRYRKPIVRDLNLESINAKLSEIQEACEDVRWYIDSDDGNDTLTNALGDEDDAYEFKVAFSELEAQAAQMLDDMQEDFGMYTLVQDHFDDFFAGIRAAQDGGGLMGFDEYESDYFGLSDSWEVENAERLAADRLRRLTKDELIDLAHQCFHISMAFISIRSRYDDLKAALDILRGGNTALLQTVREIDAVYAEADLDGWCDRDLCRKFDRLIRDLPERAWIE